ncbi:hypothetical protein Tco_1083782, partial [Tanacetum coccineum]
QSVMIGGGLSEEGRRAMHEVLRANLDIFAWKPSDMTGVPRTLAGHKLVVKEELNPSVERTITRAEQSYK